MNKMIAGCEIIKPDHTTNQSMIDEVIEALHYSDEKIAEMNERIDRVQTECRGNVPAMICVLAREVKDPVELSFLCYSMGYILLEADLKRAMEKEIPNIIKESMRAGAHMAMQQLGKIPESQSQSPGADPAPVDPMYR